MAKSNPLKVKAEKLPDMVIKLFNVPPVCYFAQCDECRWQGTLWADVRSAEKELADHKMRTMDAAADDKTKLSS